LFLLHSKKLKNKTDNCILQIKSSGSIIFLQYFYFANTKIDSIVIYNARKDFSV